MLRIIERKRSFELLAIIIVIYTLVIGGFLYIKETALVMNISQYAQVIIIVLLALMFAYQYSLYIKRHRKIEIERKRLTEELKEAKKEISKLKKGLVSFKTKEGKKGVRISKQDLEYRTIKMFILLEETLKEFARKSRVKNIEGKTQKKLIDELYKKGKIDDVVADLLFSIHHFRNKILHERTRLESKRYSEVLTMGEILMYVLNKNKRKNPRKNEP